MSRRATLLVATAKSRIEQEAEATSFVGGRPKFPPSQELPTCGLCGAVQSFFLQVAFPDRHAWAGLTLAIFQCTSCFDYRHLMPPLSREPLAPGQDIPDGVLDKKQINYRFSVFPTADGVIRDDYEARVRYLPIELSTAPPAVKTRSRVGGRPRWIQGDANPGRYEGEPLTFLLQWEGDYDFQVVRGAAPQSGPHDAELVGLSPANFYSLFWGAELYFFGNQAHGTPHIYPRFQRG